MSWNDILGGLLASELVGASYLDLRALVRFARRRHGSRVFVVYADFGIVVL